MSFSSVSKLPLGALINGSISYFTYGPSENNSGISDLATTARKTISTLSLGPGTYIITASFSGTDAGDDNSFVNPLTAPYTIGSTQLYAASKTFKRIVPPMYVLDLVANNFVIESKSSSQNRLVTLAPGNAGTGPFSSTNTLALDTLLPLYIDQSSTIPGLFGAYNNFNYYDSITSMYSSDVPISLLLTFGGTGIAQWRGRGLIKVMKIL
jgi:hypothetical protein